MKQGLKMRDGADELLKNTNTSLLTKHYKRETLSLSLSLSLSCALFLRAVERQTGVLSHGC